ncbi:MAG: hypothetical protein WDW38_005491 [Sanguina aurantia]
MGSFSVRTHVWQSSSSWGHTSLSSYCKSAAQAPLKTAGDLPQPAEYALPHRPQTVEGQHNLDRALQLISKLQHYGHRAYIAGGWVRDHFLDRDSVDIDISTSAGPNDVSPLLPFALCLTPPTSTSLQPLPPPPHGLSVAAAACASVDRSAVPQGPSWLSSAAECQPSAALCDTILRPSRAPCSAPAAAQPHTLSQPHPPETLKDMFSHLAQHLGGNTSVVTQEGVAFEVTTFRGPSRLPDNSSAHLDAVMRDLTMNSLFYDPFHNAPQPRRYDASSHDPAPGRVLDFVGGVRDLQGRCLRANRPPPRTSIKPVLEEDPVRVLRCIRFFVTLDLTSIHPDTEAAMRRAAPLCTPTLGLSGASSSRIINELLKMAAADQKRASHPHHSTDPAVEAPTSCTARGLQTAHDIGLLKHLFPKVPLYSVGTPKLEAQKLFLRDTPLELRLAALIPTVKNAGGALSSQNGPPDDPVAYEKVCVRLFLLRRFGQSQLMNELKRNKSVDSQMPLVLADLMHLLRNLRTPQSLVLTRVDALFSSPHWLHAAHVGAAFMPQDPESNLIYWARINHQHKDYERRQASLQPVQTQNATTGQGQLVTK